MMSCYARFLALVALVMLVASGPAFAQTYTDYDTDDDNLIDIRTIAQFQGIRFDHDGNGFIWVANAIVPDSDSTNYNRAFPNHQAPPSLGDTNPRMGCPGVCNGFELMNDLDFATAPPASATGHLPVTATWAYLRATATPSPT